MIALDQSKGPREPLSEDSPATAIYEELLRYRGRVLRVQESSALELKSSLGSKRNPLPEIKFESRYFSDQLGVLTGLKLQHFDYFYPDGEEESRPDSFFALFLDGKSLNELQLQRAQIWALQEDTGDWTLLLQGSGWTDFDRNYLRIYG